MEAADSNQEFYLALNGKRYQVSKDVYKALKAEINAVRYMAGKEHRCSQPNHAHCSGDCFSCRWHTNGIFQNDIEEPAAAYTTEDTAISLLTMEKIYAWANSLTPGSAEILALRFEKCCTFREIAQILGISSCAVQKRLKRMLDYLRKNTEEFF